MNKLDQMDIANLNDGEVEQLLKYERQLNEAHSGEEIYLLALKK